MVFSSISFLYYFLPLVLLFYFFTPEKYRNIILLVASLFFYFYGEPRYLWVLIFSIVFNYYYGRFLEKRKKKRPLFLAINLLMNFGILFYFKYFHFFLDNINLLFHSNFSWAYIVMPIGISFFTFQATSYIIDIYRGKVKSANHILTFATYLSLFPQLIAGPIVRYETVEEDLKVRKFNASSFSQGIKRFVIGLSKKVLLANVLGECSKSLAGLASQSVFSYLLQATGNTLQLYLDFSGYSDMAIGLGLMFGFHFLENFQYPLFAHSITDFWRRWHISLSSWLKDYIYIPLGGSRVPTYRRYLNILIVWMITGLWHGASWNFVLWGIYFAVFLILEKAFFLKFLEKHRILGHFYTIILVVISFVIFNETNFSQLVVFLKGMFGFSHLPFSNMETIYYFKNYLIVILISILAAIPWFSFGKGKMLQNEKWKKIFSFLEPIFYLALLLITTGYLVDESFNPFLYFRF